MISIKKRGVSLIISWILLMGFAISLSVLIFNWQRAHTEELTKSTISHIEGKLECAEISINVATSDCSSINITNTGKLTIDQFAIISNNNIDTITIIEASSLNPKQAKQLNIRSSSKVEVIPIIKIEDKLVGCQEKRIINEC